LAEVILATGYKTTEKWESQAFSEEKNGEDSKLRRRKGSGRHSGRHYADFDGFES